MEASKSTKNQNENYQVKRLTEKFLFDRATGRLEVKVSNASPVAIWLVFEGSSAFWVL